MKIKPNHINMTQIMKKCFNSLFVTLLVLAGLIISTTTVFSEVINCVCASCNRPCGSGHASNCPYSPKNSGGYPGGSPQQQMIQSIFAPLFQSLFDTPPDTSAQDEKARQDAIKRQKAAEQAKKAALERWLQIQTEEDLQRKMEQNAKIKQGAEVLSRTQRVGSGGELKPFSFGNPKLDLKPISQNTYPNTRLTTWERLLCSAYFSNMAKQSTKDVDARFYADQAQRVTVGEPTYLECRIPQVSNEKLAKRMEEVKKIYGDMNVKMKDLQDIEAKLTETREKIKDAEIKKEEATAKLNELQNRAATATPEEKAEVDDLIRQAQEQSQIADQQLNQAKESENDMIKEKEKAENELKNMNAKIQAGGE